jgi:hypothetical protein
MISVREEINNECVNAACSGAFSGFRAYQAVTGRPFQHKALQNAGSAHF